LAFDELANLSGGLMLVLPCAKNRATGLRAWTPEFKSSITKFVYGFKPGGF
jgi:hypothetical protein